MKQKILFLLLAFVSLMPYSFAGNGNIKPEKMRILYLGGYSDWTKDCPNFKTPADYQKTIDLRMDAFGSLLRKYFGSVKVMKATDYKPDMSKGYDVTIFDGVPPILEKPVEVYDSNGKIVKYTGARYLPYNYDYPCVTIGEIGPTIDRTIGVKNDWFCLCLGGYAHSFKSNHPIFQGPFKTKMTLERRPTPADAKEYSYFKDVPIPESLMMWKVQTESYETKPGLAVGMVSRPNGYLDSPDCEIISGGNSHKSIDAIAIGRHGNFLTWGFAASPLYMTEEAKVVFVNAVAYMAKYKGGIISRKYNEGIPVRKDAEMYKYLASQEAYHYVSTIMEKDAKMRLGMYKDAVAKQKKGEKLTEVDNYFLTNYNPADSNKVYSYSDHLQRYLGALYPLLGSDESKYKLYFEVNKPYLYGGKFGQDLPLVDEDAKTLGIPNNDKRILEKAISMLEKGTDTELANRILHRYTMCNFSTPSQWRSWYNKYKNKLFFTESGGWLFLINGPSSLPGNDYTAYRKHFNSFIPEAAHGGNTADAKNPVIVNSGLKKSGESKFIEISFNLYAGYHVYKTVSSNDSYIPMKIEIDLPQGYTKKGDLIIPEAIKFGSNGTTVFETDFTCAQSISGTGGGKAIVKVTYQTCNDQVCMPPETKEFQITL